MKIHLSILEIGAIRFAVASRGKADLEVCQCVTKQMCEKKKQFLVARKAIRFAVASRGKADLD